MQRVPRALPLPLHSWLWFVLVNKQGCSADTLLHVSAHKGQSASPHQHFHTRECIITHMNQRTAFYCPFSSTFMPSCLVHTYPGFPTFICTRKGWTLSIPLSENLKEHLSWVCHPFPWVIAGSFQGKPLFTQSQSTSGSVHGCLRYSRNPQGSISPGPSPGQQSKGKGQSSMLHHLFPDLVPRYSWEQLPMKYCLTLICACSVQGWQTPPKVETKMVTRLLKDEKSFIAPKAELKMPLQTGAHTQALKSHLKAPTMLIPELLHLWNEWHTTGRAQQGLEYYISHCKSLLFHCVNCIWSTWNGQTLTNWENNYSNLSSK